MPGVLEVLADVVGLAAEGAGVSLAESVESSEEGVESGESAGMVDEIASLSWKK